jgi:hypothetical protein
MNCSKKIESERHDFQSDRDSICHAVNKASKSASFISRVVEQLDSLKFPAYKHQILSFVQNKFSDNDDIGLLKSLNDTVLFRSKYDVKKGLEQENSETKQQHQISDTTRKHLEVQHHDQTHRRKDYPEIPATAMKNYICDFCGKEFQSKDQLTMHQDFEFKGRDKHLKNM